jgi:hypothetical protein
MLDGARDVAKYIRRYVGRQKRYFIFRVVNPLRYWLDLVRWWFGHQPIRNGTVRGRIRVALVSDLDAPTSEEQFYPFTLYRDVLRRSIGIVFLHLMLTDVLRAPRFLLSHFDVVILKLSYRTTPSEALSIVRIIRSAIGGKPLIYFDGDDDSCIQWPEILTNLDLYVKKHAFRDRNQYLRTYIGKSNLHDYVHRKYGHVITTRDFGNPWEKPTMITHSGPVPISQINKIFVGAGLATDEYIFNLYRKFKVKKFDQLRDIDVLFRGSLPKGTIVYHLRGGIEPILRELEGVYRIIIPDRRVSRDEYYSEMLRSRICVSPFGYGEICWRDYESILCQSLLIKPDMSHVQTLPNIFQPFTTYVPVKWDFSDLKEKCEHYLSNENERLRIVQNAYECLDEFYRCEGFVKNMAEIMHRVQSIEK